MQPHPLANTTPFPNGLFEWMPLLKDTEFRLLCLVVRGTWGWRDGNGGRKKSDWLNQKQIMKRTGRSSEALSRAVDSLVRRGLIEVRSEEGRLLETAAARRRYGGRLFFGVNNATIAVGMEGRERKSEEVQATVALAGYEGSGKLRDGAALGGKCGLPTTKSGVRKANTTKTTGTKLIQKKTAMNRESSSSVVAGPDSEPDPVSQSDIVRFLRARRRLAGVAAGRPVSLVDEIGDGAIAGDLLQRYGFDRLMELLSRFLRGHPEDNGAARHGLRQFQMEIKELLIQETKERVLSLRSSSGLPRATPDSETR